MSFKDLIPWRRDRREVPVHRMDTGARNDWNGDSQLSPFFDETPFFARADSLFDQFFQGFGSSLPTLFGDERAFGPDLALDLRETDDAFHVSVELPGVDDKDVDVSIAGGQLLIRGEKHAEHEHERGGAYRRERVYGRFERALPLPAEIEAERVQAEFRRGVLEIHLPKSPRARRQPKRITVRRGAD